jgi:hypothetical protein
MSWLMVAWQPSMFCGWPGDLVPESPAALFPMDEVAAEPSA